MVRILQCNLNRSWRAFDILTQYALELKIGIVQSRSRNVSRMIICIGSVAKMG